MHPWAWWAWALGVAAAVSLTTSPLLLALVALGVCAVVLLRRSDSPWARSIGAYFALAGIIIGLRLFFQVLVGSGMGSTVLFTLPELALPDWAAGIRLGGPVMAEGLVYATYEALRLGTMLLCLGAANALANPRRALRSVPAALYEASVAIVIALSVAPQLVQSVQRVRRARRLRGGASTGWQAVKAVVIPVLADAIDRSLALATSMEARGFGRTRDSSAPHPALVTGLVAAMMAATLGVFLVLGSPRSGWVGAGLLAAGVAGTVAGLRVSGRRLSVTRHRPQPWTPRDTAVAACGLLALVVALVANAGALPGAFDSFHPSVDPLAWPGLHPVMPVLVAFVAAPLFLSPAPAGVGSTRAPSLVPAPGRTA